MVEIKTLIDGKKVAYTGLFRLNELYNIIHRFFRERGYFMIETRNREEVMPDGKQIVITLTPEKTMNDYAKSAIRIEIFIRGLKDRDVVIDGRKHKYQHGQVELDFFANLKTDYRNKWDTNGFLYVVRTLSDKFIRHGPAHEAENRVRTDCLQLQEEVRSYLNMSRFSINPSEQVQKAG